MKIQKILGCANWHEGSLSWISDAWGYIARGGTSIFSFRGLTPEWTKPSRSVVVCGEEI